MKDYTYRVTWSAEDAEHVAICREFPSLTWCSNDREEALAGIRRVVAQCILDMRANNEPIPAPLSAS